MNKHSNRKKRISDQSLSRMLSIAPQKKNSWKSSRSVVKSKNLLSLRVVRVMEKGNYIIIFVMIILWELIIDYPIFHRFAYIQFVEKRSVELAMSVSDSIHRGRAIKVLFAHLAEHSWGNVISKKRYCQREPINMDSRRKHSNPLVSINHFPLVHHSLLSPSFPYILTF